MTSYDSVPYPSYCYPQSSPAQLYAISQLFGLAPVDVKKSRVLEIGCAAGGNIIPLAMRFPRAKFVGIDLSGKQTDEAKAYAEKLKLKNIQFFAASITEHDFAGQEFDYIIAHGIYSWVPEAVQDRILQVCGENLSKNGVAYVSYNTLPGWNAIKTIRTMMLYHAKNFTDSAQKVVQARTMLKFVADNMKSQSGPYKETLTAEIERLHTSSDSYLLHEYLEAVNEPCYFHEFVDKATKQGLTYLSEMDLPSMFLGNQNETVSGTLSQINDPIRLEQYLDFITNRRFRMTLLVKEGQVINRKLSSDRLRDIHLIPQYRLQKSISAEDLGYTERLELVHFRKQDQKATTTGRILCIAMIEMLKALPNRLTAQQVIAKTAAHLPDLKDLDIERELDSLLWKCVFNGILHITSHQTRVCTEVSEKPSVFSPAIVFGQAMDLLPNQHHEVVKLTGDQRIVLRYVNGENSVDQICAYVKGHIDAGEITLSTNGTPLAKDVEGLDAYVRQYVQQTLKIFAQSSLLTA